MDENCQKPIRDGGVCDIKATYSFVLEGLEGLEDGIVTRRCKYHMAMQFTKDDITRLELSTIQKI